MMAIISYHLHQPEALAMSRGAEHSAAFISTLDIAKAGGYPETHPGCASN